MVPNAAAVAWWSWSAIGRAKATRTYATDGSTACNRTLRTLRATARREADAVAKPISAQEAKWTEVKYPDRKDKSGHIEIIRGFARDVLRGGGQYAPGCEAINELEISNAAYLSGFNGSKVVELPADAAEMDRLLARLERERSSGRGGGLRAKYDREFRRLMTATVKKARKK